MKVVFDEEVTEQPHRWQDTARMHDANMSMCFTPMRRTHRMPGGTLLRKKRMRKKHAKGTIQSLVLPESVLKYNALLDNLTANIYGGD